MCVSQLKIKIFYKYTEPVCWWLFCFECSLSQAHFICCSDPIFCSHSLLAQLFAFSRCVLFSWKLGWHSGFHFRVSCCWTKAQKVTQTADACTFISFFFFFFSFRFFRCACFKLLTHWCGERGFERLHRKKGFGNSWERAYIFTEGTDGVKPVALASALRSN